ncbi:hypothetical protein BN2127_JRS1_04593 [Bacillus cereus]|nr:hypothetical protein BN2127_JRS1_04593 [Bacillus cereus]
MFGEIIKNNLYFKSCFYILMGALFIFIGYVIGKWIGSVIF